MKTQELSMRGEDRAELGCILTFENAAGRTLTVTRGGGLLRDLIPALCAEVLALDESFRVVSFSTPATIYTDLQGTRVESHPNDEITKTTLQMPELSKFGKLKLAHLLHPRLRAEKKAA